MITLKRLVAGRGLVLAGCVGMAVLVILAVIAPPLWGQAALDATGPLRGAPSDDYVFGTDSQGRDALLRALVATRLSLTMGVLATLLAVTIGVALGSLITIGGPRTEMIGGRVIDLLVAWPPIVIALAVTAIMRPSSTTLIVAVGLAFCPQFARLTNTLAQSAGSKDFVTAAHLLGMRGVTVLRRHVLPNIAGPLLVLAFNSLATSIVTMSGLSFIGLGVQAPDFDWGALLSEGIQNLYSNPAQVAPAAIGIVLAGLSAGLLGDGLAQLQGRRRKRETRDTAPSSAEPALPLVTDPSTVDDAVIRVRDLDVFGSPDSPLVSGVSFVVGPGEIVGLVGESGSGKSLTAMSIAQLTPAGLDWNAKELVVAGHALLPGAPVPPSLALDVGVVFQDPSSSFNPARRLGPQLTEAIRVHQRVTKAVASRRAIAALAEVGITEPAARMRQYPHELSGGMRQRAMIAMALMSEPRLLIADEPTTALDVTVQAGVLRLIKQINEGHGMSVLLISHDIDVISALCDRIYVMYRGQIVEELSSRELRGREARHSYTRTLLGASLQARIREVGAGAEGGGER